MTNKPKTISESERRKKLKQILIDIRRGEYAFITPVIFEIEGLFKQETQAILKGLLEDINKIKKAVQDRHGTFKYDSCYNDCMDIVKDILKKY